jgi:hypothetical protein
LTSTSSASSEVVGFCFVVARSIGEVLYLFSCCFLPHHLFRGETKTENEIESVSRWFAFSISLKANPLVSAPRFIPFASTLKRFSFGRFFFLVVAPLADEGIKEEAGEARERERCLR